MKEGKGLYGGSVTYIEGLTCASVGTYEETIELLMLGERNRHVNSTKSNKVSSRSHSICIIEISK